MKRELQTRWRRLRQLAGHALIKTSLVYIAGQLAQRALSFLLVFVYARFLSLSDYGILGTVTGYGALLASVLTFGLHGAAGKQFFDHAADQAHLRSYLTSVVVCQLALSALVVALLLGLGPSLWPLLSRAIPFAPYALLALLSTFLSAHTFLQLAILQAQSRPVAVVGVQLGQVLLGGALGLTLVAGAHLGAEGLLLGQVVASAAGCAWLLVGFVREHLSRALSMNHVRSGLVFGLPLLPHLLATTVMAYIDRPLLERATPLEQVGAYTIASTLAQVLAVITSGINQAWAPYYFKLMREHERPQDRVGAAFSAYTVGLSAACLTGALFAPELIALLLPARFAPAAPLVGPLLLGFYFGGLYYFAANPLFHHEKTGWLPFISIASAALLLAIDLLVIPRYGTAGAAWAFAAASAAQAGLVLLAALRVDPVSPLRLPHACVVLSVVGLVLLNGLWPLHWSARALLLGAQVALSGWWLLTARSARSGRGADQP